MLSMEEREAIRARCEHEEDMGNMYIDCVLIADIYALLAALWEAETEYKNLLMAHEMRIKELSSMRADRDHWQKRARRWSRQ